MTIAGVRTMRPGRRLLGGITKLPIPPDLVVKFQPIDIVEVI